ncbi:MAG: FG-GAP-like repeat-containing protein, partial [Bacteroidota bacterium]
MGKRRLRFPLVFTWLVLAALSAAAQDEIPISGDYSGESHLILGEKYIQFKADFLYEAEQDNTLIAMFGQHEILQAYGGTLTSTPGEFGISNDGVVGGTPGSFDVSPAGAATYSIPILVSPGTNDMEPNLSIVYNSQGPDGLLGKGFSLAGLSAITRVKATRYHDGFRDQVDFDENDRLALDGERLILKSGTYGSAGSEYRLENNRMAKIMAFGSDGQSGFAESLKVWEKSGLIKTYGATTDSRHVVGDLGVLSWMLNKVEDRAGNYMTYTYEENHGEYRLKRIDYTGNASAELPTYASVRFSYGERTYPRTYFVFGEEQMLSKQLTHIRSYYGNTLFRDYAIAYESHDGVLHLASVTERNSANEAYNPIVFDWGNEAQGFQQVESQPFIDNATVYQSDEDNMELATQLSGDFTGDGKADLLAFYYMPNGQLLNLRRVLFEEIDGRFQASTVSSILVDNDDSKYTGDFNGDGLTDYATFFGFPEADEKVLQIHYSNGTRFSAPHPPQSMSGGNIFAYPADFDGDGRTDLFTIDEIEAPEAEGGEYRIRGRIRYNDNDGASFTEGPMLVWRKAELLIGSDFIVMDYNADGRADIVSGLRLDRWETEGVDFRGMDHSEYGAVLYARDDRGQFKAWNAPVGSGRVFNAKAARSDFNGDGLLDVLDLTVFTDYVDRDPPCTPEELEHGEDCRIPIPYWTLYTGTGTAFKKQRIQAVTNNPDDEYHLGDFNGDGITDLGIRSGRTFNVYQWVGNTFQWSSFQQLKPDSDLQVADFTGNGISDVLEIEPVAEQLIAESVCNTPLNNQVACENYDFSQPLLLHADLYDHPRQVQAIANSYGSRIHLDYLPLTDDKVYTKYQTSLGSDELLDVQIPSYVVRAAYADNGVGGVSETRFRYEGAKVHRHGKGYLGFSRRIIKDITQGTQTTETYVLDDTYFVPLLRELEVRSTVTGGRISKSTIDYLDLSASADKTYLFAKQTETATTFDVWSDQALTTVTSNYNTYDAYGNVEQMTVSQAGGYQTSTVNTYDYSGVGEWVLGRLSTATVTKTSPGTLPSIRKSSFSYNSDYFLKSETIEPDHDHALTTDYTYDDFGNILSTTTRGVVDATGTEQSRSIHLTFDDKGRFVEVESNDKGHTTSREYDPVHGQVTLEIDPVELQTRYHYDDFGRLNGVTTPDPGVTSNTFYHWVTPGNGPSHARYVVHETNSV